MRGIPTVRITRLISVIRGRGRLFGLVLVGVAVVMGVVFLNFRPKPTALTFHSGLKALTVEIQALQDALAPPEPKDIANNIQTYQTRLQTVEVSCKNMVTAPLPASTADGKAAHERVKGICEDLTAITRYSRLLHERIQRYILLPDTEWPQPGSDEFNARLESVQKVIADARYELEGLDNSKVQDPALDELIYQVKFAQDIANKVKEAGDNKEEAKKQAGELRLQLSRDKTDFLAARQYFWNNTIGIAQLLKALTDVEAAITPTAPPRFKN